MGTRRRTNHGILTAGKHKATAMGTKPVTLDSSGKLLMYVTSDRAAESNREGKQTSKASLEPVEKHPGAII